jgi:hypothetical protein
MIEVFKTNVQEDGDAGMLVAMLLEHFPGSEINFDLEDCDKILRIKHNKIAPHEVVPILNKKGFACEVLED